MVEICMPSELMPTGMPLARMSRNGGPFWVAVPVSQRQPPRTFTPPPRFFSFWRYRA